MIEIKSIEQLLHFMKSTIQLSRYDETFIDNLSKLSQVTTNQVILFHTLLEKYRRQFANHDQYVEKLVDLDWNVTVVESSPRYTNGHITIENDMIYFTCPFNKNFIDAFRKEPSNKFLFNKEARRYEAPYGQYSLKILLNVSSKFYTVNLCPVTATLYKQVTDYETAKYWAPILKRVNGRLYILGMNDSLNRALGDIELNTDLTTLAVLSSYGIEIDKELYGDSILDKVSTKSYVEVENSEIAELAASLKAIKCDMAYITGVSLLNVGKKALIEALQKENVPYCDTHNETTTTDISYKMPVLIKFKKLSGVTPGSRVSKIVYLVNSLPIDIK